jgi:hypothetical protein
MRTSVGLVVLVACGGGAPPAGPRGDTCHEYAAAVRGPLTRMGRAADRFADAISYGPDRAARASRDLAATLDDERRQLADVHPERDDLAAAHARALSAVAELAQAMRYLADVVAARDEIHRESARARLRRGFAAWADAVRGVDAACP